MKYILLSLVLLTSITALHHCAYAQSVPKDDWKFRIGGYGVVLFQHFDYGANQNLPNGSESDSRSSMNIPRFNLAFDYNFGDGFVFESEIEFEYGGAGSAMELEYEEFGEYEMEVENGGEIGLEQMNLTKYISPAFNVRAGHFVIPVSLVNRMHVPTRYSATVRSESESSIIPVTWHETGIEFFGKIHAFNYQAQVVNGLDATGFSSQHWVAEGKQGKFEDIKMTNPAFAGRIDYSGVEGLTIGISGYYGNTTGNRPKDDMEDIDGYVTIGTADARYESASCYARAFYLHGTLQNADIISKYNASLSRNLQTPRTPVAKAALAYGGEAGYNILPFFCEESPYKLYPFVRYEYYNSMEDTDPGVYAVPRFKNTVLTFGFDFYLKRNIVLKTDYAIRSVGGGDYNEEHTFALSLEFISTFFKQ